MRLKTYIVDNVTEAIPLIKQDLGADALILNTKKVKKGGFLGLFQKDKLEVIAAVESKSSEKVKGIDKMPPAVTSQPEKVFQPAEGKRSFEQLQEEVKAAGNLIEELKSIKHFMMNAVGENRLPEVLEPLKNRLAEQEVCEDLQSEIIAKAMVACSGTSGAAEQQVQEAARKEIIRMVKEHQKNSHAKNAKMICFIGPTGVGKTTTIAKIAADYMLREDKKVGLITADTYRIAAVEQLKTYAGILSIPIKVIESSAGLAAALEELEGCDIILMDTAGRNYQQKQYIADLEKLLPVSEKVQINLVLSLTSKYEDMKKIIENFKTMKMDQLILTKKDETSSAGAVLNLIHRYSIPVRYIANGQNVPDDLIAVTPEAIADFLLGENDND